MIADRLHAERSAYLEATDAASRAVRNLLRLMTDQSASRRDAQRWLRAVRVLSEKQTNVLDTLDRFVLHANELGLDEATKADLRHGRAKLAADLGDTLREVERTSALLIGHRRRLWGRRRPN